MKIIHVSDLHLGSKIGTFPKEIANQRKNLIRERFRYVVNYASQNNIKVILLTGDIFDSDSPIKKDKDFFYEIIKDNSEIDFLYLKGNHDSNSAHNRTLPNLKLFNNEWKLYRYGNVAISGIEMDESNFKSLYSTLLLDKNDINIVLLHGQVSNTIAPNNINLKSLNDKNINYLALGHVHQYQSGILENDTYYVYPGCLVGRGFDETGQKGFVVINIEDKTITHKFYVCDGEEINELTIDVTNAKTINEIYLLIKQNYLLSKDEIYRINLTGSLDGNIEDLVDDLSSRLRKEVGYLSIKDKTTKTFDISKYKDEVSIKGEFVRNVLNSKDLNDNDKVKVINLGLRALEGKEYDL